MHSAVHSEKRKAPTRRGGQRIALITSVIFVLGSLISAPAGAQTAALEESLQVEFGWW